MTHVLAAPARKHHIFPSIVEPSPIFVKNVARVWNWVWDTSPRWVHVWRSPYLFLLTIVFSSPIPIIMSDLALSQFHSHNDKWCLMQGTFLAQKEAKTSKSKNGRKLQTLQIYSIYYLFVQNLFWFSPFLLKEVLQKIVFTCFSLLAT